MRTRKHVAVLLAACIAIPAIGVSTTAQSSSAVATGIVNIEQDRPAPVAPAVDCSAPVSVSTVAEFKLAYNSSASCIDVQADLHFMLVDGLTMNYPDIIRLDRSLQINGNGHTLTFDQLAASYNIPFLLSNTGVGKTLVLKDMDIVYPFGAWLVGADGALGTDWNVVFDGLNLSGVNGTPLSAGRPFSAVQANLHLRGKGSAESVYGRVFPRNIIVDEGADWTLTPSSASPNEPQIDLDWGKAFEGTPTIDNPGAGNAFINGKLNLTGGVFGAIWGSEGIYVGSKAELNIDNNYNGYSYGALTVLPIDVIDAFDG